MILADPSVNANWTSKILRTFFTAGQIDLALVYMKSVAPSIDSEEDKKLQLDVLLKNRLVMDAYRFQKAHSCGDADFRLFAHFLDTCFSSKTRLVFNGCLV